MAISDSFTRADAGTLGNADTGQAWVPANGSWAVAGNKGSATATGVVVWSGSGNGALADIGPLDTPNHIVQADISGGFAVLDTGCGIVGRLADATHFWYAFIFKRSFNNRYNLYAGKVNGGAADHSLVVNQDLPNQVGPWTVRFVFSGNQVAILVDGVQYGTTTDAFNNTAAKAGIVSWDGAIGAKFDNFVLRNLSSLGLSDEMIRSLRATYAAPTASVQDLLQRFKSDHALKGQDSQHAFFGGSGSFNDDAFQYWLNH